MGPEWAANATFGPAYFVPGWSPNKLSFKGRENFMGPEWAANATLGAAHFNPMWSWWTNLDGSHLGSQMGPSYLPMLRSFGLRYLMFTGIM